MKSYLIWGFIIFIFVFCWYQGYLNGPSSSFVGLENMRDKQIEQQY